MKKNIIGLLALFFISGSALADSIQGLVVGVNDGDTITVLDASNTQFKIRLSGIDAPEKKQDFGNASKKSLLNLVYYKNVIVEWHKQDRYGRTVGKVIINGMDANLEQVKRGMAWFYKQYQGELTLDDRLLYLHASEAAQASKIGLWLDNNPTPPWEFRKQSR